MADCGVVVNVIVAHNSCVWVCVVGEKSTHMCVWGVSKLKLLFWKKFNPKKYIWESETFHICKNSKPNCQKVEYA
jgi:hypothetical protein